MTEKGEGHVARECRIEALVTEITHDKEAWTLLCSDILEATASLDRPQAAKNLTSTPLMAGAEADQ